MTSNSTVAVGVAHTADSNSVGEHTEVAFCGNTL